MPGARHGSKMCGADILAACFWRRAQFWALYCLVLFYRGVKYELAPIRPISKFLVVKAVVFLTYWQGVGIAVLVWAGILRTKARAACLPDLAR